MLTVGYTAFYADGSESDSATMFTVGTVDEALAIAWADRVVYGHGTPDDVPVGVIVYDEKFTPLAAEGEDYSLTLSFPGA